ncbi:DNA polymerase III, subunits gamma and tau [Pseudopedobacter saltans DSM 12145]|uniref:DNA polymerase III subunit gamma/tau n=1 Tax=Pseudopedobacter saltans (strain ATCC 51119 / DSM 12145 / JCM 21818 / CCUG 39354 / LMG 10337 / NBRC 100064 / NCIMB 13643) TaxID=762903 RepID=F0SD58_PSESL|nr:DNA polymerase III subunit gamma/tau [Pseudopedobacter saltans]ADY52844.1 DNA polymerase III, subunits gamma and tau [Pseudopedobacter saltans DSM 12145]
MENFIVSARKYRPVTFESVVGQLHITNTLKNAIKSNQLAQAFLFCGPRGVGKTTCARILAKTINCQNLTAQGEACGICESCNSFLHGNSFNFHELDAASNNSVDDIRNLIDQVRIPPQGGKYKVYIIDEVHMLSQSAFNAFLKTLEEPPAYAIFILATTEKHKILPTILSRCQIFDFNRIKVEDMAGHLSKIATREEITFDNDGLHLIAQKADGGLRDALSMFDQIASFSNRNISYQAVIDNLNILDYDYYFKLTDFLNQEDTASTLLLFNEILNNGFDGNHFISGLASHFRNVLICKDPSTVQLLEVSENIKQKYLDQSKATSSSFLISALNIANQCDLNYKISKNQRLQVELALIKIAHLQQAFSLSKDGNVRDHIEQVKKKPENLAPQVNTTIPSQEKKTPLVTENTNSKPAAAPPVTYQQPDNSASVVREEKRPAINIPASGNSLLKGGGTLIPNIKNPSAIKTVKEDKNEPEYVTGVATTHFTQDDFIKVWVDYSRMAKEQGKMSLVSLMDNYTPTLKDNYRIELVLENKLQSEELISERIDILNYLRTKLSNFSITLEPIIDEVVSERKLYTSKDKYQHMVDKNPNIDLLRQAFGLELD